MVWYRYLTLDLHLIKTHSVFVHGKVLLSLQKTRRSVLPREKSVSMWPPFLTRQRSSALQGDPTVAENILPVLKHLKSCFSRTGSMNLVFSKCFIVSAAAPGHEHCCPAVPVQFWLHASAHFHAGKQNLQLAGFSQTASGFPPGFLSCVQFSSSLTTVSAAGVFRMTSRVWLIPKGMFSLAAKKISLVPLDWETSLGNRQICAHPGPFTVSGVGTEHEFQDQQWPA